MSHTRTRYVQTFCGTAQRLDGKATRQKEFTPVVEGGIKTVK